MFNTWLAFEGADDDSSSNQGEKKLKKADMEKMFDQILNSEDGKAENLLII